MTEVIVPQDRAALVKAALSPFEKTLATLRAGVVILRDRLNSVATVKDDSDLSVVVDLGANADKAAKLSRSIYTRAKEPLIQQVEDILADVAPLAADFESLKDEAKAKGAAYLKAKREAKAKADAEAAVAMAAADAQAAAATTVAEKRAADEASAAAFAKAQTSPAGLPALRGAKTAAGATLFERTFWTWEVTNEDEIPDEYTRRVPATGKIDTAVEAGVRTIPGLRIFEDSTPVLTGKRKPKG